MLFLEAYERINGKAMEDSGQERKLDGEVTLDTQSATTFAIHQKTPAISSLLLL